MEKQNSNLLIPNPSYMFQVSLIEGCQRILVSDCYGLLEKKVNGRQRGQPVDEEAECSVCGGLIVRRGNH